MEKSTFYGIAIFIIIIIAGYTLLPESSSSSSNNISPTVVKGDIQEVVIGMKNYNYFPDSITVDSGKPVKISLDESAYGCFRDFTIKELGVRKYLRNSEDYVEFTPDKPGTYTFACSMGMGLGKLIVK
jgi:plastocyanin domain-containing protein